MMVVMCMVSEKSKCVVTVTNKFCNWFCFPPITINEGTCLKMLVNVRILQNDATTMYDYKRNSL